MDIKEVCYCATYGFPHRMGGGKCEAYHGGVYCDACGMPCEEVRGIERLSMPYGDRGASVERAVRESDCCGWAVLDTQDELKIRRWRK